MIPEGNIEPVVSVSSLTEQNRTEHNLFGLKFTKHELLPRQHNLTIKYRNYKRNTYITNKENARG